MEDWGDKHSPLRGPSLPGSLGVRLRGDWEKFEDDTAGIAMRCDDCVDTNIQLDFMKETDTHGMNVSDLGTFGEDVDMKRDENVQLDSVKGLGSSTVNAGEDWETFDEEGKAERRQVEDMGINDCCMKVNGSLGVNERNNWETFEEENMEMRRVEGLQFDLMKGENVDLQECDLDETGRKCPISPVLTQPNQLGKVTGHQDHQDPYGSQIAVPIFVPSGESEDFSRSSMFRTDPGGSQDQTLPLPPGKKYHVFFSYEMADRDWVHSVVEKMESEHGYRCSFHERDFHGGKRVIENINEHIQWSVKTVLVLSPDFLESSWCQFEMKQGLHASIEEARMLIVPVMVRGCEVPDTLRSLTYIDATPGTGWWDRLLEAVTAQDTLQVCNDAGNQICIQPRYENFEVLCEISSKFGCCFGEKLNVPYVPEELNKPGIQISHEEFDQALSKLVSTLDTNCVNRCCCDYIPCCAFFSTLLCCFSLASVIYGLIFVIYGLIGVAVKSSPSDTKYETALILSPMPIALTYLTVFFGQIYWRKKKMRKSVMELNRRLYENKIVMDVKLSSIGHCSSLRAKITFRYYNFQPCMNHVKEFMNRADEAFGETNLSGISEQLVTAMLEEYLLQYQDGKLKFQRGSSPRHVRHARCLCQYIEDILQRQENLGRFCHKKLGIASQSIV